MPFEVYINRTAVTSMAYFAPVNVLQGMYMEVRKRVKAMGIGPWDTPVDSSPALNVVNPVGTTPSLQDIIQWLNSLNEWSDSDSSSDSASDNRVDDVEYALRLYKTLDNRVPPAFKAAIIAAGG